MKLQYTRTSQIVSFFQTIDAQVQILRRPAGPDHRGVGPSIQDAKNQTKSFKNQWILLSLSLLVAINVPSEKRTLDAVITRQEYYNQSVLFRRIIFYEYVSSYVQWIKKVLLYVLFNIINLLRVYSIRRRKIFSMAQY